jgi:hypothetical protein
MGVGRDLDKQGNKQGNTLETGLESSLRPGEHTTLNVTYPELLL